MLNLQFKVYAVLGSEAPDSVAGDSLQAWLL